ncbi:fimbrial protein [Rosenbergiella epipactidis]|uniref:fimbrial protein n=1 Tax=Rosenbergiella epipactidis TaxID=1544694 RepID=UPI001F4E497D|nr:fimbrial protein [Rosenbergiella epipactidis]
MNIKLTLGVAIVALTFSHAALADGETPTDNTNVPTTGKIHFSGELVASTCGLKPGQDPIEVEFGQIPVGSLTPDTHVALTEKNIELQGCDTTTLKHATVTYTPAQNEEANSSLAAFTTGDAYGAGIGLLAHDGKAVTWGEATSATNLVDGDNSIPFKAYVQRVAKDITPTPGQFESTINFQIDYN